MQIPSKKNVLIILAILWVLVQGALLYYNGIVTNNEAEKYIGQAYHLIQDHKLDDNKYIFYFIPILVIYTALKLHLGFAFVIAVQLLVSAMAAAAFYKIAVHFFGHTAKSILVAVIYITFVPLQEWNVYLYTESLFYSICVLFMYACLVLPFNKTATHATRILVLLVLFFTRPLGLLFIPMLGFLYIAQSKMPALIKVAITLAVPAALYFLVNFLYNSNADMNILMPQEQGMVICYGGENISSDNVIIPTGRNPVASVILFILNNPVYFFKLALLRVLSFFKLYRPGYSSVHNIYLALNMLFLYGFTIAALVRGRLIKYAVVKYTFYPLLIILCIGVMMQCNDYNSRFCMPLFPWFMLFAADGVDIIRKIRNSGLHTRSA